jgi:hypothetical protein
MGELTHQRSFASGGTVGATGHIGLEPWELHGCSIPKPHGGITFVRCLFASW